MESKRKSMKPLYYQKVIIDDKFTYHAFLKKGLRTFSSLALKTKDANYSRENPRDPKSTKLVRVFKKIKLTRRVDLRQLQILNPTPSFSAFLYIAKRMLYVKVLSIFDSRRKEIRYKGLFTTWPKYMKQLKSLCSEIRIQKAGGFFAYGPQMTLKKMTFPSDFLRFLPKLEEARVAFSFFQYCSQMDRVCQFKRYPVSLRRLSIQHPSYNPAVLNVQIQHLKELRYLEIILFSASILELVESAYSLISQAPVKLQALNVNFGQDFEIDVSIDKAIRRLANLKKAKIQFSSVMFKDNLRILQSFEECPLESLNLKISILDDQEILQVRDLISKKKTTLKKLKLLIRNDKGRFENLSLLEKLINTIDDLPELTNLSFSLLVPYLQTDEKEQLISLESSLNFVRLLSKPIPLRKFVLISSQFGFSKNRFLSLLKSLEGISSHLEKLQIDVGQYEPSNEMDTEKIINFIQSLAKIQVLKLDSLCVSKQNFLKIMGAIEALRNLTAVTIGRFSEEIPEGKFVESVGKILRKYGLRNFDTEISDRFRNSLDKISEGNSSCLDVGEIKKKNPYFLYCSLPIKFPNDLEEVW